MRSFVLAAAPVAVIALFASPARPCSPAPQGLRGPAAPERGQVNVPTNAVLQLAADFGPFTFAATLTEAGSEEGRTLDVSFDGESLALVDAGGLEPNTSYTLTITGDESGFVLLGIDPISFTTGAGDDVTAPTIAPGGGSAIVEHLPGDTFGLSSCGPSGSNNAIRIPLPEASDDVGVASFRLFRLNDDSTRELRAAMLAAGAEEIVDFEREPGSYRYVVEAVDLAGNATTSEEIKADVSGFGCNATSRTSQPGFALLVGLFAGALGLVRTARRRRR